MACKPIEWHRPPASSEGLTARAPSEMNQSGSAIYNMLGTTYNDISTNTPVSTYQVSQMAYENGFVTSWHNFSSTIFHSNGNYMCVDSLSATKMNVAQNPPSFVTCS